MKFFKLIVFVFSFLLISGVKSQVNLDSLKAIISSQTHDTNKINALITWDNEIYFKDPKLDLELNLRIVSLCDSNLKNQHNKFELEKFKKSLANSYNNIGLIYYDQGNLEKALEYHEKSLDISEEIGDKKGMSFSYNNIGIIYKNQGNLEKALEYNEKSLDISKEIGDKKGIGKNYYNLGIFYDDQGNLEKALEYYEKSLEIYKEIGYKKEMSNSYNNIGIIYADQGNLEKALGYLLKAKIIFEEINIISGLDETAKALVELYEKLGNPQKALENHKLYVTIKDSLAKMDGIEKEKQRQFREQYLLEKQADSIKHANEILIQKAETIAKEEQLNSETQKRNGLIVISLLVLVSLGLVFTQLKKVRKGKALVEEKQQEITDSINYAKRLQQGILVPIDLVQSWLSESFILYKPKDIVSGDFYWIEKVGNKVYFAVADCTGHGIPGALVSIICSNALTKALHEDKIEGPSQILDQTRVLVEERFVRSHDEIKDGMDISLCCLNVDDKSITWAGAMNPLWIVIKDSKEVEELKPDRQSIGMVENPKRYKQHEVKLAKGDSVYLFSDGYQDQFGGEKGRKYMKGRFKKFILSIQDQDMQTQLASFEKEFNSWKGNREQIDDVCVIGVRIT